MQLIEGNGEDQGINEMQIKKINKESMKQKVNFCNDREYWQTFTKQNIVE
jgi:hypothetical protein